MEEKNQEIERLKRYILAADEALEQAKKALTEVTGESFDGVSSRELPEGKVIEAGKVIEGTFDGESMVGPEGKKYPVPANYSSKSKLVEGDRLKLTVADDGSFIFKQIGPIDRTKLIGTLSLDDNVYHVLADGKSYNLLYAAVTYYKGKPGDKVTIVVPKDKESVWAALDNIIHETPEPAKEEEEKFEIPHFNQETPTEIEGATSVEQTEVGVETEIPSQVSPQPELAPEPMPQPAEMPQIVTEPTPQVADVAPVSQESNSLGENINQEEPRQATELDI